MTAYSLYDASVVMAKGALTSLGNMLDEAEKHENADAFFTARLHEDMHPLTFQVYYAAFSSIQIADRLCGREPIEATEEWRELDSYVRMRAYIAKAVAALDETNREDVNKIGETMTKFARRDHVMEVPVKGVIGNVNMTNVYFHMSMTYAILRSEGVPLGKRDWTRGFIAPYV